MSRGSQVSKNDKEAIYAALDMMEQIVTDRFFEHSFGPVKDKLVTLNAARRTRLRIAALEAELISLKATVKPT